MRRVTRSASKVVSTAKKIATPSPSSQQPPTILFPTATAFETWLGENHTLDSGLWLQISKKKASTPSVTYDEALDIALCYGWIDGQRKSLSDEHFLQRFTPRRKKSVWSKRNVDKVNVLAREGKMKPAGQAEVAAAKADGRWEKAYAGQSNMQTPTDFEAALAKNAKARNFFEALNKTQRWGFVWRIETVKKAETRARKIEQFVGMLAEGKTL